MHNRIIAPLTVILVEVVTSSFRLATRRRWRRNRVTYALPYCQQSAIIVTFIIILAQSPPQLELTCLASSFSLLVTIDFKFNSPLESFHLFINIICIIILSSKITTWYPLVGNKKEKKTKEGLVWLQWDTEYVDDKNYDNKDDIDDSGDDEGERRKKCWRYYCFC